MNFRIPLTLIILILTLGALAACGGSAPVTLSAVPTYPNATELKPGENPVADTLVKNMEQNQAISGQLGTNTKIEQKGFSLSKDATWDGVKKFYDDKLTGTGWSSNSTISTMMAQASQGSAGFQIANWQKDKQNITVILMADPTNPDSKMLLLSLASA